MLAFRWKLIIKQLTKILHHFSSCEPGIRKSLINRIFLLKHPDPEEPFVGIWDSCSMGNSSCHMENRGPSRGPHLAECSDFLTDGAFGTI